jgi:outer membrane autotransporter protein
MRAVNIAGQQNLSTVLNAALADTSTSCGDVVQPRADQNTLPQPCQTRVWAQALGSNQSFGGLDGLNSTSFGMLSGADRAIGEYGTRLGVEAGVQRINSNDALGGFGHTDSAHAGLYGFADVGPIVLSGTADFTHSDYRVNRPTGIGSAVADPDGNTVAAAVQAAWPLRVAQWAITPKFGLLYQHQKLDGFDESVISTNPLAPAFAIDGTHSTYSTVQPYADVAFSRSFQLQDITYVPSFDLGYRYDTRGDTPTVAATAQDGTLFVLPGSAVGRGMTTVGARITAQANDSWSVFLNYQGLFADHLHDNAVTFGFTKRF